MPWSTDVDLRLDASEFNHIDMRVVIRAYPPDVPFPFVVGNNLVGEVVRTGSAEPSFDAGDRVWTDRSG